MPPLFRDGIKQELKKNHAWRYPHTHTLIYIYIYIYSFELTKKRSRMHPAKTITDADYTDDVAILANTPNQAETLLHCLERADAGIGLHVNAHITEYMCYNQTGDITAQVGHHRTSRNPSETCRQIHLPRKQRLINRKGHRHAANEGMGSYQ